MSPERPGEGKTVALFATCVNDTMYPGTPQAVVRLLERLGCEVAFPPEQTCCGQMFTNTGYLDEALPTVRTYLAAFERFDYVVGPSGSCIGSVREQHPMLAERSGSTELQRRVADVVAKTYDLPELLVDVLGVTDVGAYFPHRVTYHPTCHSLRITKVGDRPYQLLRAVRGIDLVELPDADRCCGFGGTFALKNSDVSVAMTADKARHIADTGAEYVVAGDNSCLMSIGGVLARQRTGIRTIHLAEVLASTEETLEEPV
ncbi:(Fe-S)-binding protein [Arsenicicoccus sp. oral taxon 190]|uniref:(Fe-S)-binding protein n=1 Tax=Arsenicicoccus sp. oral taxon 190 TaxID=1658671 RepID=UPI000679F0E5|nr:(Fe-S)-binding protein [Arsenicicoccus sp. oral taxon 190]AKT51545.1 Fe-S oxidoreductase [Arsenicicoccus sp. oral taxon 190]